MDGSVFLSPLQNILSYFQKDAQFKSAQKDAAIAAVSAAINATLKYIEESGGHKCFDRDVEFELSSLWSDAAIKVRHVSRGFSHRLNEKADYWVDKLEWSPDEVMERKIRLVEIRQEYRDLLRNN